MLRLEEAGKLPTRCHDLRTLLAPLLCKSLHEQERFQEILDAWCASEAAESIDATSPEDGPAESKSPPVSDESDQGRKAPEHSSKPAASPRRKRWFIVVFSIGLLLPVLVWFLLPQQPENNVPVESGVSEQPESPDKTPEQKQPKPEPVENLSTDYLNQTLNPLPPRQPPETLALSAKFRRYLFRIGIAFVSLPFIGALLWLLWLWRRRWIALYRGAGGADDPFSHIRLSAPLDDIFTDPAVRAAPRRLHWPQLRATRRLDERATVAESVRQSGLFVPVYRKHPEVPDVVVLVEHRHGVDHLAGLGVLVVRRLIEEGLVVHRYDHHLDPRLLRGEEGQCALSEVTDRHPNARLLLIGDASALVNLWEGMPKQWVVSTFLTWNHRGILDTRQGSGWYKVGLGSEPQQARAGWGELHDPQQDSQWTAGQKFRDTLESGGQGPQMIVIPAGEFMMGSKEDEEELRENEGPRHRVRIGKAFALGVTEVTFHDYDRFARATGRRLPDDENWGRGKRPVIHVDWEDATAYARWLGEQTGKKYRLPTEAEWEYAARAGTTTRYWWGNEVGSNRANCAVCGSRWDGEKTAPVGSFQPHAFGLFDMSGNVWEWTQDCWHGSYKNAPMDGSTWGEEDDGDCGRRVVRGGGWNNSPGYIRSALRNWYDINEAYYFLGFRVARDF
uniref:Formylglycine-generating enzyme, required for sulfatase activity, contains SUMF1/FGE domain n=1 Tax=Candidatus Kentrum sp. FW TaxID=2126338 RepID=A0A450SBU3_9GAMM|nr:MAG: Formylglycine-generating enzyme, required for sulfatase activity, contains SUMF1/FGE domain [Candidatus Kentron sp. FW]